MRLKTSLASLLLLILCSAFAGAQVLRSDDAKATDLVPTGKGYGRLATPQEQAARSAVIGAFRSGNGISYHGGPVMLNTVNVYIIWYGNWSGNSATTILPALASSIGGSSYEHINTTYYNGSSQHVSGLVNYGGAVYDSYSRGTSLADSDIQTIVSAQISAGHLPKNTNAVYFVMTSADVNESSGFCTQYCGWHTQGTISGSDIKYSFVGNPDRCPSACEAQTTGPNGNAGADGMASIFSHELEEAISDPDLNAWYDSRGEENADKCAWTFGTESTAPNGAKYNISLGGREYLIQRNWVNASGGYCSMSY